MTRRSVIARSIALAAVLGISAWMFVIGKGHAVYLDTNAITLDGVERAAPDTSIVTIDSLKEEEMGRAERTMVNVAGPKHKVRIESMAGDGKVYERTFTIPTSMDSVVLSIPAIIAGAPDQVVLTKFVYGQ